MKSAEKLLKQAFSVVLAPAVLALGLALPAAAQESAPPAEPAAPAPAAATDSEATQLDTIEVTGSRIKRTDIEAALPVTIISREQIEATGKTTVTDAVRSLTFNSFGSYVQTSGNSFQGQAQISVRGLGANRTVVLIDGRRLPLSPVSTSAPDLNTIPLAAVERIEVLSDGASAIYGADAIGGVINIITRKDYSGVELTGGAGRPRAEGGDEDDASLVAGFSSGNSRTLLGFSHTSKDVIFLRDREYSDADFGDGVNFSTTGGLSGYGNSVFSTDFTQSFAVGPSGCPSSLGFNFYTDDLGLFNSPGDILCTFNFTQFAADTADLRADSLFAYSTFEINSNWSIDFNGSYGTSKSFGRFAPAPDFLFVPATAPTNTFGQDVFVTHRYLSLGPRDDEVESHVYNILAAAKGNVTRFGRDFGVEVGGRYSRYDATSLGRNYVLNSVAAAAAESGDYNPFDIFNPGTTDTLNSMKVTINRDGISTASEGFASMTFSALRLAGGPIGFALGTEYRDEEFSDLYDSQSEAGTVGGSAGNSSSGNRTNYSFFGETLLPVLDSLEFQLAARFDSYSDVGNEFSPKVATRWNPIDWLIARASYGQGFRAPLLSELNANDAFSAESVRDLVFCDANAIPLTSCVEVQKDTFFIANPNLKPETSDQFSFGVVFDILDWADLSIDYYNITINDSILTPSAQSLVVRELTGAPLPEGSSITRLGTGAIDFITSKTVNIAEIATDGIDLNLGARLPLGPMGQARTNLLISYVLGFSTDDGALPAADQVGDPGVPEMRINLTTDWAWRALTFTWNAAYIDATSAQLQPNAANPLLQDQVGHVPSNTRHDFQLKFATAWRSDFVVGVRDAFDRGVSVNEGLTSPFYDQTLYDPTGRMPYARFTQRF